MVNRKASLKNKHQIAKSALEVGCWYVGRGRNANVGQWSGECFSVVADCLVFNGNFKTPQQTEPGVKHEPYFTKEEGCFQPFLKIDKLDYSLVGSGIEHIPSTELEIGSCYIGQGHTSYIGRWEGDKFSIIVDYFVSETVQHSKIEFEKHYDEGGSFKPLKVIEEGEVIEPFIEDGRPHLVYAKLMGF